MKKKIYISPSSQPDNTYEGVDTNEQAVCRSIGEKLNKDLIRCGFDTKLGNYGTMYDRVKESNNWGSNLHLPIHTNAYNGKVSGTRLMTYDLRGKGFQVAKCVFEFLAPLTPGTSENITAHPELYEISDVIAPTCYIEVDFHDVPDVAKWIVDNVDEIAEAICKGVCDYYKVSYVEEEVTPAPAPEPAPTGTIYGLPTVKSGSKGDAAKIVQGALINNGFSCGSSGIDGVFGINSVAALKKYQTSKGIDSDGIVGPATWYQLLVK